MPLSKQDVLEIFSECGAMMEGHFILSSGLHSPVFLQKALVFMHPEKTEILCRALAEKITGADIGEFTAVVSPAVDGLIPGYKTARHLGVRALYTERVAGQFQLRRGFDISGDAGVIVVEDIVSTGLSIRECVTCLRALGANVAAAGCIIDRSAGKADVGVPLIALAEYEVPAYPADELPPELAALEPVKPGSRGI